MRSIILKFFALVLFLAGTTKVSAQQISRKIYVNDNAANGDVYTSAPGNDNAGKGIPSAPYATLTKAISVSAAGDKIFADAGVYDEQVIINTSVSIIGAGNKKSILQYSGAVKGKAALVYVSVPDVTIAGFSLNVDQTRLHSAIIASGIKMDNLTVKNNIITATGLSAAPAIAENKLSNAVSINYGIFRVYDATLSNMVVTGNTITGGPDAFGVQRFFAGGICSDEASGTFTENNIYSTNRDIQVRFPSYGPVLISNNVLTGGGADVTEPNTGARSITVANNIFKGPSPVPALSALRFRTNAPNTKTLLSGNVFTGYRWALDMENYRNIEVNNNRFTPAAGATDFIHISVNTKTIAYNSDIVPNYPVDAVITGNTFNGSDKRGGTAIAFYNHKSDPNVGAGEFVIGKAGKENNFNKNIAVYVKLSGQTGPSSLASDPTDYKVTRAPVTTMACWEKNADVQYNKFDLGKGLQSPADMAHEQRAALENALVHKTDASCTGLLILGNPADNSNSESEKERITGYPNPLPLSGQNFITLRPAKGMFNGSYVFTLTDNEGRVFNSVQVILNNANTYQFKFNQLLGRGKYTITGKNKGNKKATGFGFDIL